MKKSKILDIVIGLLFIAVLIILAFFWKCKWDPIVTIIAVVILAVIGVITFKQYKKLDELEKTDKKENK